MFATTEREQVVMAQKAWDDDDVADSWDVEEEEEEKKKKPAPAPVVAPVAKPKPAAAAVKLHAKKEEPEDETEQERRDRARRLVQESDLENAIALFGISKDQVNVDDILDVKKTSVKKEAAALQPSGGYFESANPQSWNEFETLATTTCKKLKTLQSSKHYLNFLDTLIRTLLQDCEVSEIRKLANMASELASAKQRDKLAQMNKKKAPPSLAGASKKSGGRDDMFDYDMDDDEE